MNTLAWIIAAVSVWAALSFPAGLLVGRWLSQNSSDSLIENSKTAGTPEKSAPTVSTEGA